MYQVLTYQILLKCLGRTLFRIVDIWQTGMEIDKLTWWCKIPTAHTRRWHTSIFQLVKYWWCWWNINILGGSSNTGLQIVNNFSHDWQNTAFAFGYKFFRSGYQHFLHWFLRFHGQWIVWQELISRWHIVWIMGWEKDTQWNYSAVFLWIQMEDARAIGNA